MGANSSWVVVNTYQYIMRKSGKHGSKFLPLNPVDIAKEKILLPGRRPCTCEATKHALINNCLECGRIVCEQEGSGLCFTCGSLVCTPKEQAIILAAQNWSKIFNKFMNQQFER
ncbi:Activating signal cointegrator 1 [Araneus ventricosus]|uniref:Activating signal cointegrator 1 n=1 Tax=Araneus ventricosus TaxID=182803 RepID=A0A4Y2GPA7_ARAVE|nr:Activating signal cointegrator 1 [Araneus ventricosus]